MDSGADVLDLTIEIGGDSKFKVSVYDKRDSYKFNVIRFTPRVSNIPENIGYTYSTFTSQIIIYIKICTEFESCEIRIVNLYNMCTTLGYDGNKLKCAFRKLLRRHNLCNKFPELSKLVF